MDDLVPVITPTEDVAATDVENALRRHVVRVYSLMLAGLMLTAAVAYCISRDPEISKYVMERPEGLQVLFAFEVIVVAVVSKAVEKMTLTMIVITFFCYSALNGVTFAVFFLFVPPAAVAFGFGVTALTFGAMALYGHQTQRNLCSLKSFLLMIVVGVALLAAVNIVLRNPQAYWATSYLGVMIFAGLTAHHAQNLRDLKYEFEDDDQHRRKAMFAGALLLYLDFVNLYMYLMRLVAVARSGRTR